MLKVRSVLEAEGAHSVPTLSKALGLCWGRFEGQDPDPECLGNREESQRRDHFSQGANNVVGEKFDRAAGLVRGGPSAGFRWGDVDYSILTALLS